MKLQQESRNKSNESLPDATFEIYTKIVMKDSLVTGLPKIVKARDWRNRIFRISVLLLCMIGFIYQTSRFILHVVTYPTRIDLDIYSPEIYNHPAYTFCHNNGVKRTLFCKRHPTACKTLTAAEAKQYCQVYPEFCSYMENKSNITVVMDEYIHYEENISFAELRVLGHRIKDMRMKNPYVQTLKYDITGPFMGIREDFVRVLCYSVNLRINSSLDPVREQIYSYGKRQEYSFPLKTQPEELFRPDRKPGIDFHVHTPFAMENAINDGIFLETERSYFIRFNVEEDILLKAPYVTNCRNYTETWLNNGRMGPRSQKACRDKCSYDLMLKYCNCTSAELFHSIKGPYCHHGVNYINFCVKLENLPDIVENELYPCIEKCRLECHLFKYEYIYQHSYIENEQWMQKPNVKLKSKGMVVVAVALDKKSFLRFRHRPKYEVFDILSAIGGLIGVWLGISLIAIIDVFQSFISIINFYCATRKKEKAIDTICTEENLEDESEEEVEKKETEKEIKVTRKNMETEKGARKAKNKEGKRKGNEEDIRKERNKKKNHEE